MKKVNTELKTGLFVAIGILTLVISILTFGGKQKFITSFYDLNVEFPSAQGLGPGSIVSLSGIPIGNISSIDVHPDKLSIVAVMSIEEKYKTKLTTDSMAQIKTQGALGDKYIYIDPGTESTYLKEGEFMKSIAPVDFLELISEKTKDVGNVADIIKEVHTLFSNLNKDGNSAILMKNLANGSGDLKSVLNDPKTKNSLIRLHSILRKIDQGEGTLGRLVNDPVLYDQLVKLLGGSPRDSQIKNLMQDAVKAGR